jgi:hypothetical protein
LLAAAHLGLKAKRSRTDAERLPLTALPALALMHDGRVVVLAQCDGTRVLMQDPSAPASRPMIEPVEAFAEGWSGELILVTSRASLAGELARFDFSWLVPSLVRYRRLLGEVLVVSLFLQLFALVSPLFFQVVMDKVLVHRDVTTLDVLVIGLVAVVVFESVLTALRAYVVNVATDVVTELANEGTDTVLSAATLTLGANVENLTLTGTTTINGTGNTLANLLVGNSANNTLSGLAGDDIYVGGAGNDTLTDNSTTSNDIYRWGLGQGNDTVSDAGGADRIEIAAGVSSSQATLTRSGNNLLVGISSAADVLTVANWYVGAANRIEEIRLADGSVIGAAAAPLSLANLAGPTERIQRLADPVQGTSLADAPMLATSAQLLVQAMAQFGAHGGTELPWSPPHRLDHPPMLLMPW